MKKNGYVMQPCFTVEVTEDGRGAKMTCNKFLCWIFTIFFAPFWNGKVYIEDGGQE